MDLTTIKPNSHTYKDQQKQQQQNDDIPKTGKVISGNAVTTKRSVKKRFTDLFFAEDVDSVKQYLIYDLVIPALKDTMLDVIQKSAEMLFYGKVKGGRRSGSNNTGMGYISYSGYSTNRMAPSQSMTGRMMYTFDDIYLEDRGQAQTVLDVLCDIIDQYGKVTVADYYNAVGVTGNGYTDRYYGWRDLRSAWIESDRRGYIINMPRCIDLRNEK